MKKVFNALLSIVSMSLLAVSMPLTSFAEPDQDIIELASGNDDFALLVRALEEAELVETLQDDGPFTVFAPTNEAFEKLLTDLDITADELLAQPDLADILTYHVVSGKVMAADFTEGMEVTTVNGEIISFDLTADPMVNLSNIIMTDLEATNGVVHAVDTVLIPDSFELQEVDTGMMDDRVTMDIVEIAAGNPDFSILVSALQEAGLVDTLKGDGPFTVFAPTNAAFENLFGELDITAEELLAQPDLGNVLTYHVVPGKVMSGDLEDGLEAETVNGETVSFDLTGDAMINDALITTVDLDASNGVIHVIDTVLIPENFEFQEPEMSMIDEVDDIVDEAADTVDDTSTWVIAGIVAVFAVGAFFIFRKKE